MQPYTDYDLNIEETHESTTAYGLHFLEMIRRTKDKRYDTKPGANFSFIAAPPAIDNNRWISWILSIKVDADILIIVDGLSPTVSKTLSPAKATKTTTGASSCPYLSKQSSANCTTRTLRTCRSWRVISNVWL